MKNYMDYRRRHEQRKRQRLINLQTPLKSYSDDGMGTLHQHTRPYWEDTDEQVRPSNHHLRRFMIQCVMSALLVGAVYWINENENSQLRKIKTSIDTAMTQEFQFATVSDWYQQHLGDPIGFLPGFNDQKATKASDEQLVKNGTGSQSSSFTEPVVGQVKSPYSSETKGVTVETSTHSEVKAVKDGLVVFVGEKKGIGETVVIQHKDSDESWYGKLDKANVKVYQEVKKGQKIGITSGKDKKGTFYFALKKGEKFIDPIQVMSFD
ncbi:M23 family metallopeptidase [Sporolactobacillus sp. CPB3-1]|uniref:M23 family metallopeptidase n=1 Tax=Sporolactobacillus mangiferae TaxID=2940498 RepID=A0ABT0M6L5_9BACL|nr:M23 family metallopeptidase [Sporolactobacillus mangiferae]MCL1630509.1 M23 family metallopeptidase [Sporolactobacillus mangiferae]